MRVSMEREGEDEESVPSAGYTVNNSLRASSIKQPCALAVYNSIIFVYIKTIKSGLNLFCLGRWQQGMPCSQSNTYAVRSWAFCVRKDTLENTVTQEPGQKNIIISGTIFELFPFCITLITFLL